MHHGKWIHRQESSHVPAFSSTGRRVLQKSQGEAFLPVSLLALLFDKILLIETEMTVLS